MESSWEFFVSHGMINRSLSMSLVSEYKKISSQWKIVKKYELRSLNADENLPFNNYENTDQSKEL